MEALISAQSGLAVVVDGQAVLSIHADTPELDIPRKPHEVRWLLGGADDVITLEGVRREDVVARLQREQKRQLALMLIGCLLDSDPVASINIRQQAALELEELLQEVQVVEDLCNVLWSVPAPPGADFFSPQVWSGNFISSVKELIKRLEEDQVKIRNTRHAWDTLPDAIFEGERESWKQKAVYSGLFRMLAANLDSSNYLHEGERASLGFDHRDSMQAVFRLWLNSRDLSNNTLSKEWNSSSQGRLNEEGRLDEGGLQRHLVSSIRFQFPQTGSQESARLIVESDENDDAARILGIHRSFGGLVETSGSLKASHYLERIEMPGLGDLYPLNHYREVIRALKKNRSPQLLDFSLEAAGSEVFDCFRSNEFLAKSFVRDVGQTSGFGLSDLRVHSGLGLDEEALRLCEAVQSSHRFGVSELGGKGLTNHLGVYMTALRTLSARHVVDPSIVFVKKSQAEVLKSQGRYEEALNAYAGIQALDPQNIVAKNGCASVLMMMNRWEDALGLLPSHKPYDIEGWVGWQIRGLVLLRTNRLWQALDVCNEGLDGCPVIQSRENFRRTLALTCLELNMPGKALETAQECDTQALSPNLILVQAAVKENEKALAEESYARVLQFPNVDQELSEELEHRLDDKPRRDDGWVFERTWRQMAEAS